MSALQSAFTYQTVDRVACLVSLRAPRGKARRHTARKRAPNAAAVLGAVFSLFSIESERYDAVTPWRPTTRCDFSAEITGSLAPAIALSLTCFVVRSARALLIREQKRASSHNEKYVGRVIYPVWGAFASCGHRCVSSPNLTESRFRYIFLWWN